MLVWTWKLFTAYFLCPPGRNLGALWLGSSKHLIICLTLNTCLHPIWVKVKPVLKCFAGSNIPHLVGSHILQDRALSDTRLKEKEPFFLFCQKPNALSGDCTYCYRVPVCVCWTLMMGSLKIHSSHVQREGAERCCCCGARLSCRASLGDQQWQQQQGQQWEVRNLINSLKPWYCCMTFWAPFSQW